MISTPNYLSIKHTVIENGGTRHLAIAPDQSLLLVNWSAAPNPRGVLSNLNNTVGYDGYLYDEVVNLSYVRNRLLDSETGRWVSRDPVGYEDGMELYQYVSGEPTMSSDPSGRTSQAISGLVKDRVERLRNYLKTVNRRHRLYQMSMQGSWMDTR